MKRLTDIVRSHAPTTPIFRTDQIGHAWDAKAGAIGARYRLTDRATLL